MKKAAQKMNVAYEHFIVMEMCIAKKMYKIILFDLFVTELFHTSN